MLRYLFPRPEILENSRKYRTLAWMSTRKILAAKCEILKLCLSLPPVQMLRNAKCLSVAESMQAPGDYTDTLTTIQTPYDYTDTLRLCSNPTTIQTPNTSPDTQNTSPGALNISSCTKIQVHAPKIQVQTLKIHVQAPKTQAQSGIYWNLSVVGFLGRITRHNKIDIAICMFTVWTCSLDVWICVFDAWTCIWLSGLVFRSLHTCEMLLVYWVLAGSYNVLILEIVQELDFHAEYNCRTSNSALDTSR